MAFDRIADRVRLARILFNFTQANLALLSGVKMSVLNKIEQNAYRPASSVLSKIAQTIQVEMHWFVDGRPSMFTKSLVFAWLNVDEFRKHSSWKRTSLTIEFVDEAIVYLVECLRVSAGCLIPGGESSFAVLRCNFGPSGRGSYLVLNTDRYTGLRIEKQLARGGFGTGYELPFGPTSKNDIALMKEFSRVIEAFYQETPSRELWKDLQRTASQCADRADERPIHPLAEFGKFLMRSKLSDVFSPRSVLPPDKVRRILEVVHELDASENDVLQVLDKLRSKRTAS